MSGLSMTAHSLHGRRGTGEGATGRARAAARAAALAAAVVAAGAAGCGHEANQANPRSDERLPQQVVADLVLRESKAGRLSWVLRADSAYYYGEGERTRLRGVHVEFYNTAGDSVRSRLTAREGEMDPVRRDLVARDSVDVRTHDGTRLETEELRWVQETEKVLSDRFVRLTRGRSVVTGIGIESDAALKTYRILSQVSGELREEDGGGIAPPR
jgi:LPS export ABC transporter protein LptC